MRSLRSSSGLGKKELIISFVLSIILTIALFYLTFEVPAALDEVLKSYFPDVYFDVEAIEVTLKALRPIGYASLAATAILIALGIAIKRTFLAILGSWALYAPTFGYFALAMFFLAGLGALRSLWLPILEVSPAILKLGCVVYLPFAIVPSAPLAGMMITFLGLFVFSLGAATWLYGRFKGCELVDFWIYKYSRHPQYLGFLLWSYGLLIFVSYKVYVKGAFATPPALVWLITAMIVIGVALIEEVEMVKKHGEKYESYRRKAPFMIPMPKPLAKAIVLPMETIGIKGLPRNAREVAIAITLYAALLMALSYALMLALRV